jgi:hypothetical protein
MLQIISANAAICGLREILVQQVIQLKEQWHVPEVWYVMRCMFQFGWICISECKIIVTKNGFWTKSHCIASTFMPSLQGTMHICIDRTGIGEKMGTELTNQLTGMLFGLLHLVRNQISRVVT